MLSTTCKGLMYFFFLVLPDIANIYALFVRGLSFPFSFTLGLLLLESDLGKGLVGVRLSEIPKARLKFENDTLHFSNPSGVLWAQP